MSKFKCRLCGYIYNPEAGDDTQNIQSGTEFNNLPDDWVCPICGADKSEFEEIKA